MTKTHEEVIGELTGIFRTVLQDASIQLNDETTAHDVKDWDSLHHIELVLAIEKHFKFRFNFAELQKFKNVGQMCDNIVARLAQNG
jgi:acyl carrier protein